MAPEPGNEAKVRSIMLFIDIFTTLSKLVVVESTLCYSPMIVQVWKSGLTSYLHITYIILVKQIVARSDT